MNEQEMNVAIAEACGWTEIGSYYKNWDGPDTIIWDGIPPTEECQKGNIRSKLPNYTCDLNAMHEAEKTLKSEQREVYAGHLAEFHQPLTSFRFLSATALQRAEAFLRTISKFTPTPKEHE